MQFKVPQFLDIEDKIFGPFTFAQFVYLAGGAGITYILFKLLGLFWGFIPIVFIVSLSGALAFYKPNDKPFIYILESGLKYAIRDKLYIWKRSKKEKENIKIEKEKKEEDFAESRKIGVHHKENLRLGRSKLRDLAWSLDVLDLKKDSDQKDSSEELK